MEPIKKIIIVGNSPAALLTAAILAKNTTGINILLLDGVNAEPAVLAESSSFNINGILSLLGVDESRFIVNTQATFKLAHQFSNWAGAGHIFNHAFGAYGSRIAGVDFNQIMVMLQQQGHFSEFDSFSVSAVAAKSGRFAFPEDYKAENLPSIRYGMHFNLHIFLRFLVGHIQQLGVKRIPSLLSQVELREDGAINSILTIQGEKYSADFYVDCTGHHSLLLGKAMNVPYQDWSACTKVDRCLFAVSNFAGNNINYSATVIRPTSAGIVRAIPLREGRSLELFYSSDNLSDQQARAELSTYADIKPDNISPVLQLFPGRRCEQWRKNCLAVGDSFSNSGIDFYSSLSQTVDSIVRFLDYFPSNNITQPLINEYNRIAFNELDSIRDYHLLHHFLLKNNHPLACADLSLLPENLVYKLKLFKVSGRLPWRDDEVINMHQWVSLLMGMGYLPERYDPMLETVPFNFLIKSIASLESAIKELVSSMPSQRAYLSRITHN